MISIEVTPRELATIIAALRVLQHEDEFLNLGENSTLFSSLVLSPDQSQTLLAHLESAFQGNPNSLGAPLNGVSYGAPTDLERPVANLEFSVRTSKCLQRLNINTLAELVQTKESELRTIRNFGDTSFNEIKARLASIGLCLRAD